MLDNSGHLDFETAALILRVELYGTANLGDFFFDGNTCDVKDIARRIIHKLNECGKAYFTEMDDSEAKETQMLRACLRWCVGELRKTTALSESWRVRLSGAKINISRGEKAMLTGYFESVYHFLWGAFLNIEQNAKTAEDKQHLEWANIQNTLLPCYVAVEAVCYLPSRYPDYQEKFMDARKRLKSAGSIHVAMIDCLETIQELPDKKLEQIYMEALLVIHNYIKGALDTRELESRRVVMTLLRSSALERIKRTLMIIVPETGIGEDWSDDDESSIQSIQNSALQQTLAPSLRSESLRWMKQRWKRSLTNLSSRVSRERSNNNSAVSMSFVSDQMNSLAISDTQILINSILLKLIILSLSYYGL
jgi:hypothetical protein